MLLLSSMVLDISDQFSVKSHIFLWILPKEEMWAVSQCLLRRNTCLKPVLTKLALRSFCKKGPFYTILALCVCADPPTSPCNLQLSCWQVAALLDRLCGLSLSHTSLQAQGKWGKWWQKQATPRHSVGVGVSLAGLTLCLRGAWVCASHEREAAAA